MRSAWLRPLGITVVLVAACGSDSPIAPSADGTVQILTTGAGTDVMTALNAFTLEYDPVLNCLYQYEPDNNGEPGTGGRVVIVWPSGYTARVDDDTVRVFDEAGSTVAQSGEPFLIGGGGSDNGDIDHCDAIGVWFAAGPPLAPDTD